MPKRHVLGEFLLRDPLLDLKLSVFHTADVAVDDADMVFLANDLFALRMGERILHLHPFPRLDSALDVLARLIAGSLNRLFERENIFPGLPALALVHHAAAADLARIDIVNAEELVELLMKAIVLGLELARE